MTADSSAGGSAGSSADGLPRRWPANLLQLEPNHILVEQLRLVLRNHAASTTPAFIVSLLVVFALGNESNSPGLHIWFACHMANKLYSAADARSTLAAGITAGNAIGLVRRQLFLNVLNAVTWVSFAWLTLGNTSTWGSIMVIGIITAIASSAMTMLAPVLPVYVAFLATLLGLLMLKFFLLENLAYGSAMSAACVAYFF